MNKDRKRVFNGLEMGSKVALLYSKTQSIEELNAIQDFYNKLEADNVVVYYILYNKNMKQDVQIYPVNYMVFGPKDFSVWLSPKEIEEFHKMQRLKFDYIINCNTTDSLHCTSLLIHSNASIKVGFDTSDIDLFDVSLGGQKNDVKSKLIEILKRLKQLSS